MNLEGMRRRTKEEVNKWNRKLYEDSVNNIILIYIKIYLKHLETK